MNKFLLQVIISFFFFYSTTNSAQSRFSHEVGGFFGIASLQTDFGDSGDFPSANQSNLAVGLTHYLKFFGSQYSWRSGSSYFSDHFKLKTEFLYTNNTSITHDGKSAEGSGVNAEKLRAMKGAVKLYNVGVSLEYYFLRLEDYSSFYAAQDKLNPYISLGVTWSYYDPDITVNGVSLPANSDPYESLIPKWQNNSIYVDPNSSFGVTGGLGLRYSIEFVDLYLAGTYQYFLNDDIDGLDAINDPANKNNDSMVVVNLGVVYVFGKN